MRRVVIFVFDGLQAELVTPELMPNLHAFARGGARLLAHQPVFPTVTRVNATSMVTGSFPGRHGLSGNMSVFPEFDPVRVVNAMEPEFRELLASDVPVLLAPTLAEVLADHGLEYIATGIGSTGQSFVHHPRGDSLPLGASIHPEYTIPGPLSDEIERRFGPWPAAALPNSARIDRLIEVVTEYVIAERDAAVTLLWCSEPDSSQHASRLGSPRVHEAARAADAGFGRLLAWLRERRLADQTNVIVTCDHGHSTVSEVIPVRELLLEAGFAPPGSPGGVASAGNGGSVLFSITDHSAAVSDRLVEWLVGQRWAGPLLASERLGSIPGTLPARLVGLEGPRCPDLALSMQWDDRLNEHGAPGHAFVMGGPPAGQGQHGSMAPTELRTFTAASGPDIRPGDITAVTGHPDLAPTVLRILGLDPPRGMQGEVIGEALAAADRPERAEPESFEAVRAVTGGEYRQRITLVPAPGGGHLLSARAHLGSG